MDQREEKAAIALAELRAKLRAQRQAVADASAKHAESLKPKRPALTNTWPEDRWVGTRGIAPQNESERTMLEACDEQNVSWSEKKSRLLALRADMPNLNTPEVL